MSASFSSASRVLIVAAAIIVVIAGLKQAAPLIVPFLLSVFIAVISFPFMSKLQQGGLPKALSLTVVILVVLSIGVGVTVLIGTSMTDFSQMLPEYQQKISAEWSAVLLWLNEHGIRGTDTIKESINPAAAMGLLSAILKGFGNVLTNSFLILLTVVFILVEAAGLTQKIITLNSAGQSEDNAFSKVFVEKLRNYMSMKTIISMLTGVVIGLAMWVIGVDYPVLWGVLAFMFNFVPNIGSIIAAVPAVILAVVPPEQKEHVCQEP